MAEETLLSAARRVVRFFNIDMNGGGLIAVPTQEAVETLDKMVRLEVEREKAEAAEAAREKAEAAIAQPQAAE